MHATQPQPSSAPAALDPDPADTLRRAGEHLAQHGWIQHAYFDDHDSPQPAACALGALAIAAYGYANPDPYLDTFRPDDEELADAWHRFVTAEAALIDYLGLDCVDPTNEVCTVHSWNDSDGRTAADVITTLHAAANALTEPATEGAAS
jgi:hypothetical protein